MLGKRKREATVIVREALALPTEHELSDSEAPQDLFRQYFEARFKPLERSFQKHPSPNSERHGDSSKIGNDEFISEEGFESEEWEGISNEDNATKHHHVQVIEHTTTTPTTSSRTNGDIADIQQHELKSFMNPTPPSPSPFTKPTSTSQRKPVENQDTMDEDALNLTNDMALHRLLHESHLLSPSSSASLTPTGLNRHKALDLRLQRLHGSKRSLFAQESMPLSHRRGILRKEREREEGRRREAREGGVVLEKPPKEGKGGKGKGKGTMRKRDVGAPNVGRYKGGTLSLSKRDLFDIQGPGRKGRGRGSE